MSAWSYINGVIEVNPSGRTQAEMTYVLDTVLNHLPIVSGSESDMEIYVNKKHGHDSFSSDDEYGERTNNLIDTHGNRSQKYGWLCVQSTYIITISSSLRDRMFEQTFREFMKWLVRLAKRVSTTYIDVTIRDSYGKQHRIYENSFGSFYYMDETLSLDKDEPRWVDHLMWKRATNSWYPAELYYKYYFDEENDKRVENYLSAYDNED